jgi:hypothetical protein
MPTDLRSAVLKMAADALKQSGSQPEPAPEAKKPLLSTGKAILLGAGLGTAGAAVISARGRELVESLRDRVEGQEDEQSDEPEAGEEDDFEDEEYDEPEAEEDEDFEDEDDYDEPEAEEDDDFEDEEDEEEPPKKQPRRRRRARSAH